MHIAYMWVAAKKDQHLECIVLSIVFVLLANLPVLPISMFSILPAPAGKIPKTRLQKCLLAQFYMDTN